MCTSQRDRRALRRISTAVPTLALAAPAEAKWRAAHVGVWTLSERDGDIRRFDAFQRRAPVTARCTRKLIVHEAPDIVLSIAISNVNLVRRATSVIFVHTHTHTHTHTYTYTCLLYTSPSPRD